jgi:uncharacterized protein (DUF433 family)
VLAERVLLSAWTLQTMAEAELVAIVEGPGEDMSRRRVAAPAGVDVSPQAVYLAANCLEKALDLFLRLRADASLPGNPPAPTAGAVVPHGTDSGVDPDTETFFDLDFELDDDELADLSNEWPVVPRGRGVDDVERTEADEGEDRLDPRWRGRLVFDPNVSEHSPVVKGTWVTVSQVVSLIVDGWSWSDILRTHPELNEDDIRTCLAYTVAEDDGEL